MAIERLVSCTFVPQTENLTVAVGLQRVTCYFFYLLTINPCIYGSFTGCFPIYYSNNDNVLCERWLTNETNICLFPDNVTIYKCDIILCREDNYTKLQPVLSYSWGVKVNSCIWSCWLFYCSYD